MELGPFIDGVAWQLAVMVAGLLVTLLFSSQIVRKFASLPAKSSAASERKSPGWVIGKCENILAYWFVVSGALEGLAIVFAAKALVRSDRGREDETMANWYLTGTLVNLVWSMAVAVCVRVLVFGWRVE